MRYMASTNDDLRDVLENQSIASEIASNLGDSEPYQEIDRISEILDSESQESQNSEVRSQVTQNYRRMDQNRLISDILINHADYTTTGKEVVQCGIVGYSVECVVTRERAEVLLDMVRQSRATITFWIGDNIEESLGEGH